MDRLGERVAATCRDRAWSYRQLDAEANRVAWGLLEAGVERDRAVALLADRGLELMAMMIGTFKAGAAYLPLDPSLPRSRLVNLLKLGGVPALVVGEGHQAWLASCSRNCRRNRGRRFSTGPPSRGKASANNGQALSRRPMALPM